MNESMLMFLGSGSPSPRETRVEWSALGIGLALGVVFGLSTAHGRTHAAETETQPVEQEQVVAPEPNRDAEPEKQIQTSERRRNTVPVQWISEKRAKSQPVTAKDPQPKNKRPAVPVTGKRTLAYWRGLNEIIAKEGAMRAPPADITAANAGEFLNSRTEAAKFAANAILELDARGVDRELLVHAGNLAEWYAEEEKVSARGSFLLNKADAKTRKGAGGKQWKGSEEEHRKKCDELNKRGVDLQGTFSKKYKLEFPALL